LAHLAEAAATKDGMSRRSFAFAPTADPITWALPYLRADGSPDPALLHSATAALPTTAIPPEFLPTVKAKLEQASRRMNGVRPTGLSESDTLALSDDDPDDEAFATAVALRRSSRTTKE
jgi:hypothetical protein